LPQRGRLAVSIGLSFLAVQLGHRPVVDPIVLRRPHERRGRAKARCSSTTAPAGRGAVSSKVEQLREPSHGSRRCDGVASLQREEESMGAYIEIGELKTWYDEAGSGEPLVLLHGGLSTNETWGEGCQNSDSPPKQSFDSLIYLAMFKLLRLVKQRARAGQTA
jgi:hypothetical protein